MVPAARLIFGLFAIACFGSEPSGQACSTFDVASIKLNTSGLGGGYPELAPGGRRFSATNQLIVMLIMYAYDVSPLQISGIPSTFSKERFDIEATCEQPITKERLPHMLQVLLAERFHLSVHRELKEERVFALVVGKGGPKFHESSQEGVKPGLRQNDYRFTFTNAGISNLAGVLSQLSGRKVLDRTGLSGQYDFTLNYAPNPGRATSVAADGLPDSIFTALREQLGLSLEPKRAKLSSLLWIASIG